jgi:hypothetical protein
LGINTAIQQFPSADTEHLAPVGIAPTLTTPPSVQGNPTAITDTIATLQQRLTHQAGGQEKRKASEDNSALIKRRKVDIRFGCPLSKANPQRYETVYNSCTNMKGLGPDIKRVP